MQDNRLLIQRAGEALKGGNKRQARALLLQAVRQDARDHIAWLGLARVAPSAQASLDFARRAARLQPDDPLVHKVLVWAEQQVVNNQQTTTNKQQSTISNQQPATGNQQPATDDQQPATSNQPTHGKRPLCGPVSLLSSLSYWGSGGCLPGTAWGAVRVWPITAQPIQVQKC